MKGLTDDESTFDAERLFRAGARVVGIDAVVVTNDDVRVDSMLDQVLGHSLNLVAGLAVCITGDKDCLDLSCLHQLNGGVEPTGEKAHRFAVSHLGTENDPYWRVRCVVDVVDLARRRVRNPSGRRQNDRNQRCDNSAHRLYQSPNQSSRLRLDTHDLVSSAAENST